MVSSSCWSLFLLLAFIANPAKATISFIQSGKTFLSRQDTHIGQPLTEGYQYMGRLQYIPENPTLCPGTHKNQKFDIVVPKDGLPGELLLLSWIVLFHGLFQRFLLQIQELYSHD